ncbi:hypothetical protein M2317_003429 [Microbacterium sp. ZKA21]|uniref:hypothetical protein n=1 Tax=Microbacterium sp. ZKA21 TaxID=3381694 RepID=UPI003D23F1EB
MTWQHLDGDHELPTVFSGPVPPAPFSRRRRGLWIIVACALVLAAGGGIHLAANLGYDASRASFQDAEIIAENRQADLAADAQQLDADAAAASDIAAADSAVLMPLEARADLDAAIAAVEPTASEADAATAASFPEAGPKPTWTWELFAESARLADDTRELEDRKDEFVSLSDDVADAASEIAESALDAVRAAAASASDFEAAHVNARNPEIIALRTAAESASSVSELDAATVQRYTALEATASGVLTSEQAELAEKDGDLYGPRIEIEAFARSLAPGVLIDFDWAPTVPGYDEPSYGGWTSWWYGDPGYATIALSDYIAESWPAEWTKALVAHEVGHAISVKCESMYDSSDQDTIEAWATAWAISMGFTDRGNGTDVYGSPGQPMIDAASACR